MADPKITVDIDLKDDLSPKLDGIKKKLQSMPEGPHEGGGFMGEQIKELTSGIGYQFGLWNLGYMIADQITKGIGTTISASLSKEFESVKFENLTRGISGVNELLTQTKQIADATNQSFKDVTEQRFTLEKAGVPYGQQAMPLEIIGKMAAISGEHADKLAEMAGHIKEGTAGEQEMLDIAQLISPEMEKQVQALREQEVHLPQILRQMEKEELIAGRLKTLQDRQYEDQMRISNIRTESFEKLGVAETAFQDKYRNVHPGDFDKQSIIREAAYGSREELQSKFRAGQAQIQKEMGYSDALMTKMINSGLIGSKDLLEASQRSEEARKRGSDRAFEDQRQANQMKREGLVMDKEETKLGLMQKERDALFDQVKAQETLNQLTEQYNKEQATAQGSAQKVGREIQSAQEDAGQIAKSAGETFKQPWERLREPAHPSPRDTAAWLDWKMSQQPAKPEQPAAPEGTFAKFATETTLQALVKVLETLFQ